MNKAISLDKILNNILKHMGHRLFELYLILSGVLAPADPGVLERVAERRIQWDSTFEEWRRYEVLVAPSDCTLLGKSGWLITSDKVYTAFVIDCEKDTDRGQMTERGLMADVNLDSVGSGWLVLRD